MKWLKSVIKFFLPYGVILLHRKQSCHAAVEYTGNYSSWEAAARECEGYSSQTILDKVEKATVEVLSGKAVFERDSVLFFHEEPNYPLISNILVKAKNQKELKILDYGGSLGSAYFQNRKYLSSFDKISWRIVEQPHFVKAGRKLFHGHSDISFYETLDESMLDWEPDIVLFSGVLQYLPDYAEIIRKIKAAGIRLILIDRTLLYSEDEVHQNNHRFCIQTVSPEIYAARYPVQMFDQSEITSLLEPEYTLFDKYLSYPDQVVLEKPRAFCRYYGLCFERIMERS